MSFKVRKFVETLDRIGLGQFFRPAVRCLREQREIIRIIPKLIVRKKRIEAYLNSNSCRKLHIGASDKTLSGWLNTDVQPTSILTVFMDATKPFPLPSQSLDFVYCEHFIEHISFADAVICFREVFRCLKEDGVFRVATPDLRRYVDLFSNRLMPEQKRFLEQSALFYGWNHSGPCIALNHLFYNWGHRFLYSREELTYALTGAGFLNVYETKVGESGYDVLHNIEQHGKFYGDAMNRFETMVLEATKRRTNA